MKSFCDTCRSSGSMVDCSDFNLHYNSEEHEKRQTVCVDPCLVPELYFLWENGIITYGCCCGHGRGNPVAIVNLEQEETLKKLGYCDFIEITPEHSKNGDFEIILNYPPYDGLVIFEGDFM